MTTQPIEFVAIPFRRRFVDISGRVFGKITVLGFAGEDRTGKQVRNMWWCRCECGTLFKPRGDHLKSGNTTNCGCVRRISVGTSSRTHGHCNNRRHTSEYGIWCAIVQRCTVPTSKAYKYYGGRGITICDKWRKSFASFLSDMGPRPRGQSIDRINVNGNYEPHNCQWTTHREQMQNTRRNHLLTFRGETLCATEFARQYGIVPATLFNRLRSGWSIEDALLTPPRTHTIKL